MIGLVHITCRQGRLVAVEDVSVTFGPGLHAVAGPNGAGKTTLLRTIAGLHRPVSGEISGIVAGQVALLPQSGGIDRQFPITCRELVSLGAWAQTGAFRPISPEASDKVEAALSRMGLGGLGSRLISDLSAGQFQRVLFARLIVQDTSVILLDEPFTAVDAATEADLLDLLHEWDAQGRIVIAVLHDNEMILQHFPTTLLLARHMIASGPSTDVLRPGNRLEARLAAERWSETAKAAA